MTAFNRIAIGLDAGAFARATFDIDLDEWQRAAIESKHPRLAIAASRQSGKSVIASIIALRTTLYKSDQLVLVLSPSLRQSSYLFSSKIVAAARRLKAVDLLPVTITGITATSITFSNGSRIVSLPDSEATIRGYSNVSCLIADEASRISPELFVAVRPMLATSKGRLVMVSTPWIRQGDFYHAMTDDDSGFEIYKVSALEIDRISDDFLDEERKALGPFFACEYLVEWLDTDSLTYFGYTEIQDALSDDVEPLFLDLD